MSNNFSDNFFGGIVTFLIKWILIDLESNHKEMEASKFHFIQIIQDNQGIISSLCKTYYEQPADQEDAQQEIILQLWKAFPNFKNECKISTWIYRVSLNTLLAQKRNQKRKVKEVSMAKIEMERVVFPSDDYSQLLQQVLGKLNARDKGIFILHLEGYPNKEIAEILNLSASNISTCLNRIKSKFKTQIKL